MASAVANLGEDDIPEHLLCPICFELPDSEVFQCVDGHVLCKTCFVKLKECPHCRRSFTVTPPIRNRHFEAQLDDLKANCPFHSNGCGQKLTRNILNSHKATCPYNFKKYGRFINICKFIGFDNSCKFLVNKGNTKDAAEHLVTKHGCVLTEKPAFQIQLTSFGGGSTSTNFKWTWTPVISKQKDSFVLVVPLICSKNKPLAMLSLLLEQFKTSEIFEVEYALQKDSKMGIYTEIPLTLSDIQQSPYVYDRICSQSPIEIFSTPLNIIEIAESFIVNIKIRKNEKPLSSRLVKVYKEQLFSLAKDGNLQSFKSLFKEASLYKNMKNKYGSSLLHFTMYDSDKKVGLEKAKFLVEEMNADVFVLTNKKDSLLHYAADYSDERAVKYFLEKGLDINAVGSLNKTPLHCACFNKEFGEANAKMLLTYNPNCTLKDSWGKNPLKRALSEGKPEIAALIRQAFKVNN